MVKTRTFVPTAPGIHTGIRLLDLATGGGRLLADSREAVSLINQGSLSVTPLPGTLLHRGAETEFIEYSTATGKVGRVLGHWTFGSVGGLSLVGLVVAITPMVVFVSSTLSASGPEIAAAI